MKRDGLWTLVDADSSVLSVSEQCRILGLPRRATTNDSYFHIFHSAWRESHERLQLERKLDAMADSMDRHIGTSFRFSGTYETYYDFTYAPDGTFLMYREKSDVVEKELRHCGYFTIVTSAEMDAEKAIAIYKSRDENEKLFRVTSLILGTGQ